MSSEDWFAFEDNYGTSEEKVFADDNDYFIWGFAHQIFVVFARKHPEIKLEPVNMSEDVAKMYAHVMH